jgi:vacuolar-type H+-ATPase catalytic subunit A/Vma1
LFCLTQLGLLENVFSGLQEPLLPSGPLEISKNLQAPVLDRTKKWPFSPNSGVPEGSAVSSGDIIGSVQENDHRVHKILVHPHVTGKLVWVAKEGEYAVDVSNR